MPFYASVTLLTGLWLLDFKIWLKKKTIRFFSWEFDNVSENAGAVNFVLNRASVTSE